MEGCGAWRVVQSVACLNWRSVKRRGVALALEEGCFSKWRGVALAVVEGKGHLCRKRRG